MAEPVEPSLDTMHTELIDAGWRVGRIRDTYIDPGSAVTCYGTIGAWRRMRNTRSGLMRGFKTETEARQFMAGLKNPERHTRFEVRCGSRGHGFDWMTGEILAHVVIEWPEGK